MDANSNGQGDQVITEADNTPMMKTAALRWAWPEQLFYFAEYARNIETMSLRKISRQDSYIVAHGYRVFFIQLDIPKSTLLLRALDGKELTINRMRYSIL